MQKKFILLKLFVLFAAACFSQAGKSFEINGVIENKPGGKILLQCYDEKGSITDYVSEIKNHRFYFKGNFIERTKASLVLAETGASGSFFIDTGIIDIRVKIDTQRIDGKETLQLFSTVTGSKSQAMWDETVEHFGKISRCEAPDSVKSEDFYNAMFAFAKQNPDLYVTRELMLYNTSWSYEQLNDLFNLIPKEKQETALGAKIKKQLAVLKETRPNRYIFFPTQKDVQGKPVTLDDIEFTYLLIDFWASWCTPCRREHPDMISLFNRYKPQGFNVLGISVDKQADKAKWLRAIQDDQLPWKQVSDLKGFETEIMKHYSLEYIPYNMLIDRNGKILATDLRGDDLGKKLKEIFANSPAR